MFEQLPRAEPDAILGLTEVYKQDPSPQKINLSVGVYKDAEGRTPILGCVKAAEDRILREEQTKSYLPINGSPEYGRQVRELLLGNDHPLVSDGRAVTAHTPGGTGALRVAADFLHTMFPGSRVWLSEPTWPNHPGIFRAAGHQILTYPYFDREANGLAYEPMLQQLRIIPEGDVVVLHGCCHNPTGIDPTAEQWDEIAAVVHERRLLPLLDFAYQGFAAGLNEDSVGLRALCQRSREILICSSFSKNFGIYNERTGALTLIAAAAKDAEAALGHIKLRIRTNYSNPPSHGAAIVTAVLSDPELRTQWEGEVTEMRDRINRMRQLFVETLAAKGVARDFSFISRQRGMFSFSGLNQQQVARLRETYSIYVVGSGRINVAGMTEANMDRLCGAIAEVL